MSRVRAAADFLLHTLGHQSSLSNRAMALARIAHRQAHKRITGTSLFVTWEGFSLEVQPDSHYAALAYYYGWPDYWELSFLDRFLRPGDVVVDVGANVGIYAMFMAKRVGSGGRVVACEPDATNLARLRANLDRNGLAQVRVLDTGIGDYVGVASFQKGRDTVGQVLRDSGGSGAVQIPMTTLDAALAGLADPTFVKVDVEGFEAEVAAGAAELAKRGAPLVWQVELWGIGNPPERQRLATLLEERSYAFYAYDPQTRALVPKDHRECRHNLFAIRDVRAVQDRLGV
jgi:FkbM family methyltransferase